MKFNTQAALAAAMLCGLTLSACASAPNPLDLQTRNGFYVKDAPIDWTVDDAKKTADAEYAKGKKEVADRVQATVVSEFKNSPSGSQPVHFRIKVKTYNRVGLMMGNLIGGTNDIWADVDVVRDSDGKVMGTYASVHGMYSSNGGVLGAIAQAATHPDIPQIMAASFAKDLRKKFEGS
jgi:hypothetical protein